MCFQPTYLSLAIATRGVPVEGASTISSDEADRSWKKWRPALSPLQHSRPDLCHTALPFHWRCRPKAGRGVCARTQFCRPMSDHVHGWDYNCATAKSAWPLAPCSADFEKRQGKMTIRSPHRDALRILFVLKAGGSPVEPNPSLSMLLSSKAKHAYKRSTSGCEIQTTSRLSYLICS